MASISSSPWSLLRLSLPWDLPPTISCSEDLWNWNYSSYKGHIPSFQTWLFFGKMTSTILSSNGQCPFTSNPVHTSLLFSSKHLNWIISFFWGYLEVPISAIWDTSLLEMPGLEWFVNIKSSPSSLSSTPRWSSSLPSAPLQVTTICTTTRHGQMLLMVHHAITFVLGILYVYFWMMARSLFLMVSMSWIWYYKENICQHYILQSSSIPC